MVKTVHDKFNYVVGGKYFYLQLFVYIPRLNIQVCRMTVYNTLCSRISIYPILEAPQLS
jgi:hypothetical protein